MLPRLVGLLKRVVKSFGTFNILLRWLLYKEYILLYKEYIFTSAYIHTLVNNFFLT